jgi:arginine decarboxylase
MNREPLVFVPNAPTALQRPMNIHLSSGAGIGWVQQAGDGPGLFVELHDEDRGRLEAELHSTLNAMRVYRDIEFGPVQTQIASTACIDRPVCAPVVAVFACEPW